MVWVNLLPWRQTEHLRRWRFWRLMGVLVMLLLCTLALNGQWLR
ncbi:MAG TPA: fimbrial assembly protein, partial [Erwinia persicina]|nr:fimbrial assembly protein [Erwinia persicina]HBT52420.1 fimbrial assembly protein [Erwinia persicina]